MERSASSYALGIDIGGTSIKGGLVDIDRGRIEGDVRTVRTPQNASAEAVSEAIHTLIEACAPTSDFSVNIPVGIGFPSPLIGGIVPFVAHLSSTWVGMNAPEFVSHYLERHISMLNDADAAGLAELAYGNGIDASATVVFLTLGTGIGSAVFSGGMLVPNTELGHIYLPEQVHDAESWAAPSVRTRENLSVKQWAQRLQVYLSHVETVLNPDVFILGGGISERFDKFVGFLSTRARILPATLRNNAGIIGAARYAFDRRAS